MQFAPIVSTAFGIALPHAITAPVPLLSDKWKLLSVSVMPLALIVHPLSIAEIEPSWPIPVQV